MQQLCQYMQAHVHLRTAYACKTNCMGTHWLHCCKVKFTRTTLKPPHRLYCRMCRHKPTGARPHSTQIHAGINCMAPGPYREECARACRHATSQTPASPAQASSCRNQYSQAVRACMHACRTNCVGPWPVSTTRSSSSRSMCDPFPTRCAGIHMHAGQTAWGSTLLQ